MPRTRILVCCAVLVGLALLGFLFGSIGVVPPAPSAAPDAQPSNAVAARHLPGEGPQEELARVPLPAEELEFARNRMRGFENFGVRRIGAKPGGLRVTVVQGGVPLVGAFVQMAPLQSKDDPERAAIELVRGERPVALRARTDVEGQVQFDGEYTNGALAWAMHGDTMVWRKTGVVYWKRVECRIELGTAIVRGIVHDGAGNVRPGAVLVATTRTVVKGSKEIVPERFVAVSDARGRFSLEGLPAAEVTITCLGHAGGADERQTVDTARNRDARVSFGAEPGARWWRGRVVDAGGRVLRGGAALCFEHEGRGEKRSVAADFDGTFAARLPAGSWRGYVAHEGPTRLEPVVLRIAGDDVEHDLCDRLGRVLCRIAPGIEGLGRRRNLEQSIALDGEHGFHAYPRQIERGDETWLLWSALQPRVYRMIVSGQLESFWEPAGGHQFDLTGGVGMAELDLVVR